MEEFAPLAVEAAPWDTLQEKLRTHYAPKLSKIAARHAFYHRNQAERESISNYLAALRKAALHCEFRDLDDALMDRVVCGIRNIRLQQRLLAKPDLTLQKAMEEAAAAAAEAAELSAQEIRKASSPHSTKKPVLTEGEVQSTPPSQAADVDPSQATSEVQQGPPESSATAVPDHPPSPHMAVPSAVTETGNLDSPPTSVAPQSQQESANPLDTGTGPRRSTRVTKRPSYLWDYLLRLLRKPDCLPGDICSSCPSLH
ncbi:uncharacterized protein LOC118095481 [Zootoca vivipara]|uniref:uncharacterized protein LOC118095481 n=1 Tax=Zootoca vivipara TaxID=8524 RepID=UPI001591E7AF|nr:uncharacterized protein LOC118095481 [Zootoca vivipara]